MTESRAYQSDPDSSDQSGRCVAFGTTTGRRCVLENDHAGPHKLEEVMPDGAHGKPRPDVHTPDVTEPTPEQHGGGKFRKKPVAVEARLYTAGAVDAVAWCGGRETEDGCLIDTLEGTVLARSGDWIIQGVAGEFYPCKPEIFSATYEPDLSGNPAAIKQPAADRGGLAPCPWGHAPTRVVAGMQSEYVECRDCEKEGRSVVATIAAWNAPRPLVLTDDMISIALRAANRAYERELGEVKSQDAAYYKGFRASIARATGLRVTDGREE